MKLIRQYYDTLIILVILWCVLNEQFTLNSLAIGTAFSLVSIVVVHMLFSDNDDVKNYRISPILLMEYLGVLIFQIVKAGVEVSIGMFRETKDPVVVHIRTSVHNHWFQCLIANSITLTPGTVTIDKTDHNLQVLWLNPTTDDPVEQAAIILGPFERVLKKGDYRK